MRRVRLAGLLRIELPGTTVCLSDGGTVSFDSGTGAETYGSRHATFGSIENIDAYEEGTGDQAPALTLTLLPAEGAAASALSSGSFQGSRLRGWIAEIDDDTGLVSGDPDLMFDGAIDVTTLKLGGLRRLEILCVSRAERIFVRNKGNTLSGGFHKRIYPGELGLDNAAGVPGPFAWGAASPPRTGAGSGGLAGITPGGAAKLDAIGRYTSIQVPSW